MDTEPQPPAQTTVGAVAVIIEGDRILLARSRDRGWEPPGGFAESAEFLPDTLTREVLEETGYAVSAQQLTGLYQCVRSFPILSLVFLCEALERVTTATNESLALRWYPIAAVESLVTYAPHLLRIRDALSRPGRLTLTQYAVEPFAVLRTICL